MAIKKQHIIILVVSAVIAVGISFIQWNKHNPPRFESKVYAIANGWGYDILVNGKLLIHQESIPALAGNKKFQDKQQATQAAELVIHKIKKGLPPTITKPEIDQICRDFEPLIPRLREQRHEGTRSLYKKP